MLNPLSFELQVSAHYSNLQMLSEPFENIPGINLVVFIFQLAQSWLHLKGMKVDFVWVITFQMTLENKLVEKQRFQKGLDI